MTDEQLREAVARLLNASCFEGCEPGDDELRACTFPPCRCRTTADAAIALMRPVIRRETLEEAAKVAEAKADEWATVWRNRMKADSHMEGKSDGADEIAAAIRALKEKPNE